MINQTAQKMHPEQELKSLKSLKENRTELISQKETSKKNRQSAEEKIAKIKGESDAVKAKQTNAQQKIAEWQAAFKSAHDQIEFAKKNVLESTAVRNIIQEQLKDQLQSILPDDMPGKNTCITTLLESMMAIYEKESDPSDASPVVEPGLFKFIDQPITFNDAKGNSRETILKWPQINENAMSIFDQDQSEDRSEFTKEVMKLMTVDDTPQFKDVDGMSIMLTEKSAITALKTSLTDKITGDGSDGGVNLAFAGINLQAYLKQYGLESSGVANQQDILLHSLLKESLNPTQQTAPSSDELGGLGAEGQVPQAIDPSKQDAYEKAGIILADLKEPRLFNDAVKQSVADDLNKVLANDLAVQQVQDGGGDTLSTVRALNRQDSKVFEAFTEKKSNLLLLSLTRPSIRRRSIEQAPVRGV